MNEYEKTANDFLVKTDTTLKVEYLKTAKYFDDDKDERDIYQVTLLRGNRHFVFTFGNSINNSGRFWKYGNPKNGISQGVFNKTTNKYNKPAMSYEWDINKNFKEPTTYDILAALTKYDPGTFEDFCSEFGYDTDSRKAEKTYQAVKNEYTQLCVLFNDVELTELQDIN